MTGECFRLVVFDLYFCKEALSGQFVEREWSMANEEQLSILKQGVDVWNKWREENPDVGIDLRDANLKEANLGEANLGRAQLWRVDFSHANLRHANLWQADLRQASLSAVNLREANLDETNLYKADFRGADLQGASFIGAKLWEVYLGDAIVAGSKWSHATIGISNFGRLDLSEAIGLEDVVHDGPCTIGIDTLILSKGKISEVFLRGCGLSDADVEYGKLSNPDLSNEEINKILYRIYDLRANQAIQVSPLFISYSHGDSTFVDRLERNLNKKGIRFWRDIHDMKAGRIETQIDRAITQNRTVLLVLSEHSLNSDWVEHEVRTARLLEKDMGRDALCPVALDDSWKDSRWPKRVMEQITEYNILDFSAWEDDVKFEGMFRKLIDGLELFYKDKPHGE
jgi:uncharacterized protein YjbI with pentapeptide repeats